jgi:uncharacterized protein (TIGR03437 family)
MKNLLQIVTVVALGTVVLNAQTTVDSSGSGMLKGAYRFRQVAVLNVNTTTGAPTEICAAFGVITFDGVSSFTLQGGFIDNTISGGAAQTFPANLTGSYAIGSNGTGLLTSPMNVILQGNPPNTITGAVAQGVFTGSDTEDGDVDDIFIAIPVSTPPTNATFTKAYTAGVLDFTGASSAAMKNALFNLTPNGSGGLGTLTIAGQAANQSAASITQTVTGATYNFASDGNASLTIPLPSGTTAVNALFTGSKSMYVSSDGNFVLGWTNSGFDIFFGVSALTASASNSTFQGTYFTSALEDTPTGNGTDNYYGSILSAAGNGSEIVHHRLEYFGYYAYDYISDDATNLASNGTTTTPDYFGYQYAFGDGGKAFVAIGTGGTFSLLVGTQAPVFTGSGTFLNPTGIYNSASYAPITASIAPGEMLTLFGTGMAPTGASVSAPAGPVPTLLGGVQVLFNNIPAPVFYVSPTQISAIVPYALAPSSTQYVATIQINNNGVLSNPVSMYLTDALPGVFSQNQSGIGLGAVLHNSTSALVTESNPAQTGEYLQVYLTGLGTVTPTVANGALGPVNPLSYADVFNANNLVFNFYDPNSGAFQPATVTFAGLAPNYAGLYQINVQVPTGVGPGDIYLDIDTDFAETTQVVVPVSTTSGAAVKARSVVSRVGRQQPRPEGLRRDVSPPRMPVRSSGLPAGLSKSGF